MRLKPWLILCLVLWTLRGIAQPYSFYGYTLYDYLVTANHPNGCSANYVTGLPEDSTWVNMLDYTVMTGNFGFTWMDHPGDDLLLETSFHRDNYSVRMILSTGGYSGTVLVTEPMWTEVAWVNWKHIFPGCVPGQAASPRFLLALDFADFGIFPTQEVTGIEITFLPTAGAPDFAGAYILIPLCPDFSLGPDTILCQNETIDLDATTPMATYHWQDGYLGPVYHNAGPGLYWVDVTIFDCTVRDTIIIDAYPQFPDLGPDIELCDLQTLELDATSAGATYIWQDQSTDPTYTVTSPGHYAVTITNASCSYSDDIDIIYAPPVLVDLGPDVSICEGETIELNASTPGATYEWQDQSAGPSYIVSESGTYAVTVDINGCIGEDMIDINVDPAPEADLGNDEVLCAGSSLYLNVFQPGATYLWQDQSDAPSQTVTEPGLYAVTVTLGECVASDEILINVQPPVTINLGNDTTLCVGQSLLLDATTPGATYTWQDQSSTSTFTATQSGNYSVTVTIGDCSDADTIHVDIISLQLIDFGPDTSLCSGDTLVLQANVPGATLTWQDMSSGSDFTVDQTGTYWVVAKLEQCTVTDTLHAQFYPLPYIDLGHDTSLCSGDSLLLDVFQNGASYVWQDMTSDSTLTVNQSGAYWVEVSIGTCMAKDTISVIYQPAVTLDLGRDTAICAGEMLVLMPTTNASSLIWQDMSSGPAYTVSQSGTYWVTASIGQCSVTDSIHVSVISLSSVDLGPDTTLCTGQTLLLETGLAGVNHAWQDGSTASSYLVQQAGQYWVEAGIGLCLATDTIQVNFTNPPVVNLGPDTTLCQNNVLVLDATTNAASYAWQDQNSSPTYTVDHAGSYWVSVTTGHCAASDTIVVSYQSLPLVDLGCDTSLCEGQSILLTVTTPDVTYQWTDQSTQSSLLVQSSGTYSVTVDDGKCENSDSILVTYLDVASVSLGSDTTLCAGETLILDPHTTGAQHLWQDQSTQPMLTVTQPGLYWVMVSLSSCTVSDSILVNIAPPVTIDIGPDTTLCPGETYTLTANASGASSILWSDGHPGPKYTVTQSGTYSAAAMDNGCYAYDTAVVTFVVLPVIDLGGDTTLCDGSVITLDITTPGATYAWQDQTTAPVYVVDQPGTYTVTVYLDHCLTEDAITIAYQSLPVLDLGPNQTICHGTSLLLDPGIQGAYTFTWSDLSTAPTLLVTAGGTYWLEISDNCGVVADSIEISLASCDCQIYMPNVFSPNGDGINDFLTPAASCTLIYYHLQIFDRAGGLMFETGDPGTGWNGLVKNQYAQGGVYAYLLEYAFELNKHIQRHGDVTLIR